MQNSKESLTPSNGSKRNSDVLKVSHNIITNCDLNAQSNGMFRSTFSLTNKMRSKLPGYVFDPHQPNPQLR